MKAISVSEGGLTFWWASIDGLFQYREEVKDDGTVVWKGHIVTARLHLLKMKHVPGVTVKEFEVGVTQ